MSIISNSNAAKAKHLMGSYSRRGAGVSSGKVSQFYKDVFLQEGDNIRHCFYSGYFGTSQDLEDLEINQEEPGYRDIVTLLFPTDTPGVYDRITFGQNITAIYGPIDPADPEGPSQYSNYESSLVFHLADEPYSALDITTLLYGDLLTDTFGLGATKVFKIHDKDLCDAAFAKLNLNYGFTNFNYTSPAWLLAGNLFECPPLSAYNYPTLPVVSDTWIALNDQVFNLLPKMGISYRRKYLLGLCYKQEVDTGASLRQKVLLCYQTYDFSTDYEAGEPCLRVSFGVEPIFAENADPSISDAERFEGVKFKVLWDGYNDGGGMIDEGMLLANCSAEEMAKGTGWGLLEPGFDPHKYIPDSIVNELLYLNYKDSDPCFINSCANILIRSNLSQEIFRPFIYTSPLLDYSSMLQIQGTSNLLRLPYMDLNVSVDGTSDISRLFVSLLIDSTNIDPQYGIPQALFRVAYAGCASDPDIADRYYYTFSVYEPFGANSVCITLVSDVENPNCPNTFSINAVKMNGQDVPLALLDGLKWRLEVFVKCNTLS